MQVGLVSLGMHAEPLDRVLEVAVLAGAEAIELNGRATVHQNLWSEPIEMIKAKIEAAGIKVTSLGGYCDFAQRNDEGVAEQVEQFVAYCRVAREMGVPVVRAFAGDVVEGYTLDDFYPRIVQGFKAVCERVADWGIRVGIENHGHLINNGDQLLSVYREVDSPVLGFTLDTGNFCWHGHPIETAYRFSEELAPYVVSMHIKDGRFEDGRFQFMPAGRGDLDLPGILATLRAAGFDGPVVSEFEGAGEYVASTCASVAYLRGVRDALER